MLKSDVDLFPEILRVNRGLFLTLILRFAQLGSVLFLFFKQFGFQFSWYIRKNPSTLQLVRVLRISDFSYFDDRVSPASAFGEEPSAITYVVNRACPRKRSDRDFLLCLRTGQIEVFIILSHGHFLNALGKGLFIRISFGHGN